MSMEFVAVLSKNSVLIFLSPQSTGSVNAVLNETKAIDGDPNTRWVSTNISTKMYKFYIESILDGQKWISILNSGQSAGNTNSFELFPVSVPLARYVRVTVTGTIP